jgi:hypothetical protein
LSHMMIFYCMIFRDILIVLWSNPINDRKEMVLWWLQRFPSLLIVSVIESQANCVSDGRTFRIVICVLFILVFRSLISIFVHDELSIMSWSLSMLVQEFSMAHIHYLKNMMLFW